MMFWEKIQYFEQGYIVYEKQAGLFFKKLIFNIL
jgi:hypothetical protein